MGGVRQVGKYRLAGVLGRGKFSTVYEAVHPTLGRPVAMKMLAHELVYHPHFARRFRDEARIIASLRHPSIVEVYDTEEAYATLFIVMERLSGALLRDAVRSRGRLSHQEVRDVLRQLASALHCAHTHGVIHRDVNPSNVVLGPQGEVKLMDFGLAVESGGDADAEPVGMGTPGYMAPEQVTGEPVDARADVYALGVVAFEMLVGRPPFEGDLYHVLHRQQHEGVPSPRSLLPGVPQVLDELVCRATARDPDDRFTGSEAVLRHLGGPLEGVPLGRVGSRTLTVLYEPSAARAAEELVEETMRRAANVPGIVVR
jgi:serine/threonine-protein kinase